MNNKSKKEQETDIDELHRRFFPVVKFLKKKKLKLKYARIGDSQVEYFRMQVLQKVVEQHSEQIKKILKIQTEPFQYLLQAVGYLSRPSHIQPLKYPQELQPSNRETQFGTFKFSIQESRRWLMFLVIAIILFLVLFPIWPYQLKYVIWLVSLYLMIALGIIIAIRLLLYSFFSILGISFWLFPNLLQDTTIIDSFKPLYSVQKWQKNTFNFIIRIIMLGGFVYYTYDIYSNPQFIFENLQITKTAVKDVHDWGVSKIKGETNFSQRALTNLADILNQTADVKQTPITPEFQKIDEQALNEAISQPQQQKQQQQKQEQQNYEQIDIQKLLDAAQEGEQNEVEKQL